MPSKLHIEPRSWFSKLIDIRELSRVVATEAEKELIDEVASRLLSIRATLR